MGVIYEQGVAAYGYSPYVRVVFAIRVPFSSVFGRPGPEYTRHFGQGEMILACRKYGLIQ